MSGDFTNLSEITASECMCFTCVNKRMKAATCKCGHVGAECFNDEYCNPAVMCSHYVYARRLEDQINDLDTKLQRANAEIDQLKHSRVPNETAEFWRNAFMERGDTATQVEIAMANKIAELEQAYKVAVNDAAYWHEMNDATMDTLVRKCEEIDDLQADYASDCTAWSSNYRALNDAFFNDTQVADLETTIRVLAGMVS